MLLGKVISPPFDENTYIAHLAGRDDCIVFDPGFDPDTILDYLDETWAHAGRDSMHPRPQRPHRRQRGAEGALAGRAAGDRGGRRVETDRSARESVGRVRGLADQPAQRIARSTSRTGSRRRGWRSKC